MTDLVHVSTTGKQDYGTPQAFVDYVALRFGLFFFVDLAADDLNRKCPIHIGESRNSLTVDWKAEIQRTSQELHQAYYGDPAGWLNPPFKKNPPFMAKCHVEKDKGTKIASLTLSSLGTNWFKEHCRNEALNLILEDRMIFEGQTDPYPKELMLSLWGIGLTGVAWISFKKELNEEAYKIAA